MPCFLQLAGPSPEKSYPPAIEWTREAVPGSQARGENRTKLYPSIGVSSLHATAGDYPTDSRDVRLRCAMRASSREEAELLLWEVESLLCCGPAGGGGYRGNITPSVITYSTSVDRGQVKPRTEVLVA